MRLINTSTLLLHDFPGRDVPLYAILSHRWEDGEVTFHDMQSGLGPERAGWIKIIGCCSQAARDGWEYIWIDTCCIDRSCGAEVSEAINAMFAWYRDAQVCYVFLSDVPSALEDPFEPGSGFRQSRWFRRGWTLQELLAPPRVEFYARDWTEIGTKSSLEDLIVVITSITHLFDFQDACVAQKMSWAAGRATTRAEDEAYCLMGLFDVNMPILYGEGAANAFLRLQQEIIGKTDDESIFAWSHHMGGGGLLADAPAYFARSGDVRRAVFDAARPPHAMTSRGLRMELILLQGPDADYDVQLAPLNCAKGAGKDDHFITLQVTKSGSGLASEGLFQTPEWEGRRSNQMFSYKARKPLFGHRTIIFFPQQPSLQPRQPSPAERDPWPLEQISVPTLALLECGFHPSQRSTPEDVVRWTQEDVAAPLVRRSVRNGEITELFFTNEDFGVFDLAIGMTDHRLWVDIVLPLNPSQRLSGAEFPGAREIGIGRKADRISRWLRSGLSVSASVKVAVEMGKRIHKVDVIIGSGDELRWPERRIEDGEWRLKPTKGRRLAE
ncbi:HET domain protein [Drepanopeziza brunnea f. sp. 'multigermtubi' MB_m1]|uniref:HET domain protein n=2 Tax=Drepanopeziza brunnea f. sp. 'multigermtubi' TaxID=698441 RepID=K1X578_MARBU|nr:HET domain protein [Drepanopeziza brunnea f. sp. 'multigermtubi' MB_m1]EKD15803.1 HET domain protein [Drepanopeziza brunnea f. sp. 'multigermtubi' MB_m1]